MSQVNPILLIQMMMHYGAYRTDARTFRFAKNNRMRVHEETPEECEKRKSIVDESVRAYASKEIRNLLQDTLRDRIGGVWMQHPGKVRKIAIPTMASTGENGFGVMSTGSSIPIPEGKKIRAFTYWEKVNDIDLSCFGLTERGEQREFSWRNMYDNQSNAITFSGDQTSGYNGGSEYFDIDLDEVRRMYPQFRYIVFCDNIYTGGGTIHFKDCKAKAGFMTRDILDSGEVFEPKTVQTSFALTSDSSFSYMFAIDLINREMIWLNLQRSGDHSVAGMSEMGFLMDAMKTTDIYNAFDFFVDAGIVISNPIVADILITDEEVPKGLADGKTVLRTWDIPDFIMAELSKKGKKAG